MLVREQHLDKHMPVCGCGCAHQVAGPTLSGATPAAATATANPPTLCREANSREERHAHDILLPHKAAHAFDVQVDLFVQLVGTTNVEAKDVLELQ